MSTPTLHQPFSRLSNPLRPQLRHLHISGFAVAEKSFEDGTTLIPWSGWLEVFPSLVGLRHLQVGIACTDPASDEESNDEDEETPISASDLSKLFDRLPPSLDLLSVELERDGGENNALLAAALPTSLLSALGIHKLRTIKTLNLNLFDDYDYYGARIIHLEHAITMKLVSEELLRECEKRAVEVLFWREWAPLEDDQRFTDV
jgi:hypothetical protein